MAYHDILLSYLRYYSIQDTALNGIRDYSEWHIYQSWFDIYAQPMKDGVTL